jgi:ribosome recycling factor
LAKEKTVSEDDKKRSLDELEKLTHSETKKMEDLAAIKEQEIIELK